MAICTSLTVDVESSVGMIKILLFVSSLAPSIGTATFVCRATSKNVTDYWCQNNCAYPNGFCAQHCACRTFSPRCNPIPLKFIKGVVLKVSDAKTPQACCDFCASVPGCTAWVLDQSSCAAKNKVTEMSQSPGSVSGTFEECGIGSDPFPVDISFQRCPHMQPTPQGGGSVEDCSAYCCQNKSCRSWQFLDSYPRNISCQTSPFRFKTCPGTSNAWSGASQSPSPSPSAPSPHTPAPVHAPSPSTRPLITCGRNSSVMFPIPLVNTSCAGLRNQDGDSSAFKCYQVCCQVESCNTWQYNQGQCYTSEQCYPKGCGAPSPGGGVGGTRPHPKAPPTTSPAPPSAPTVSSTSPSPNPPNTLNFPWWYFFIGGGAAAVPIALAIVIVAFKCRANTEQQIREKTLSEMASPLLGNRLASRSMGMSYGFDIPMDQLHLGKVLTSLGGGKVRRGGFAGQQVALKKVSGMTAEEAEGWQHMTEASLLCSLHHPHIVRFYGIAKKISTNGNWVDHYLVMDYKSNDLGRLLSSEDNPNLGAAEVLRMARETSSALEYLHSVQVVHRDLDVESILLDNQRNVFLCNFGFSKTDSHSRARLGIYTPPEVRSQPNNTASSISKYLETNASHASGLARSNSMPRGELNGEVALAAKGDCYAFAMVLWALMAWRHPRSVGSNAAALIHWRPPLISIESSWPTALITLMKRLWDAKPSQRPTMKEAAATIQTQMGRALFQRYFNPSERRMMDDSSDGGGNFMFTSDIGGASDMDTSAVDTPMVRRMSVLAEVNRPRDDSSTSNDDIDPPLKLSASTRALTHTLSNSMTHTRVQTSDSDSSLLANDGNFASDMSDIEGGASDMDTSAVDTPMVTRMSVLAEVNRPRDDSSTSNDDVSASDDDIGPPLKLSASARALTHTLSNSMRHMRVPTSDSDSFLRHADTDTAAESAPE